MKPIRLKTCWLLAWRLRDSLAPQWRRIRAAWQSDNYPAWMTYLPNPLPRDWKPIRPLQPATTAANKRKARRTCPAFRRPAAQPSNQSPREHFAAALDLRKLQ